MTKEHKLALVFGFAIVLIAGVLISDHFSGAHLANLEHVALQNTTPQPLLSPSKPLPTQTRTATPVEQLASTPQPDPTPTQPPTKQDPFYTLEAIQNYAQKHGLEFTRSLPVAARTQPTINQSTSLPPTIDDTPIATRAITVAQGDSLWKLTQNITGDGHLYKKIAAFNANQLKGSQIVHPGMTILFPQTQLLRENSLAQLTALGNNTATLDAPTQTASTTQNTSTYTVKSGDVLSIICQNELGTIHRLDDVLALNRGLLNSPDSIRVGMVLKLPQRR